MDTGNIQMVVLLKGYIRNRTVHDTLQINGNHFVRKIFTLTVQKDPGKESISPESLSLLYQLLHRIHLTVQLIKPRTIDGTTDLNLVLKTVEYGVNRH